MEGTESLSISVVLAIANFLALVGTGFYVIGSLGTRLELLAKAIDRMTTVMDGVEEQLRVHAGEIASIKATIRYRESHKENH